MPIKYIVEDDYYIVLDPDGNEIARGSKKDKRYVDIEAHGLDGEYRIIQPDIKVGLISGKDTDTSPNISPPNQAPEWQSTPNPSWVSGQGGTYDLNQNTVDAENDTLTYVKTAGTFPTGISLAGTGILTATTAVTSAVTAGFTITADDGTNSPVASPTFSITVTSAQPLSQDDFPRLGVTQIGGWGQSSWSKRPGGFTGRMARIGAHDYVITNTWRTWTYDGSQGGSPQNNTTIANTIKTYNPSIKVLFYTNVNEASDSRQANIEPYKTFANDGDPNTGGKGTDEKWWLYTDATGSPQYPADVAFPSGNFPSAQINIGSNSQDAASLYCPEWWVYAFHANSTDSGDWVSGGYGFRSEYGWDGIYQDIMRYRPRTNGDYDENGTNDDNESSTAYTYKAQGDTRYQNKWASVEPTYILAGNMTFNAGTGGGTNWIAQYAQALSSGYQNLVSGCLMEATMGRSNSRESYDTWDAMMAYYKRMMTLNQGMNPQITLFENWEVDGFNESDPNIWGATHSIYDWGRYGLCSCLQDNGYYGYPTSGGFVDCNVLDEYSFNLGTPVDAPKYDGTNPATSTTSGYLDYEQGVHLREFQNGLAIVNPKGNGTKTITLPSAGSGYHWARLNAADYDNQDPTTNDGATVTQQTLPERHGIIIRRVAD